ncbi:MAG TPA: hypothetical protein VMH06_00425, partial [Thermodesulfovibrionales bacterium]|nr:hypothetical protein [Thermodesulfovibrionales bacterium]
FFPLFQQGVAVSARTGCSIAAFLREQLGVSPGAFEKIQSIFLDGSAVDELDSAIIKDGSVLALSAAMPGLVGATMRRGGRYSSFRSGVTHRETEGQCASGEGFVQVKLFNLLMAELGPGLLAKGIYVTSSDLRDFLAARSGDFRRGWMQVILDGKSIEAGSLNDTSWLDRSDRIFLSVTGRTGEE